MKIHHYVEQQARLRPEQDAVIDGDVTLSYELLIKQSKQLASYLWQEGVRPGDFVPMLMQNSAHAIISILAILNLNAVYVPLNTLMKPAALQKIIDKLEPKLVLVDEGHANSLSEFKNKLVINSLNYAQFEEQIDLDIEEVSDLCYTIFTTGTTGFPKGVMVSHKALESTFLSWLKEFDLQTTDRHLQLANLGFDVFTGEWLRALCSGGTLVILPRAILLAPEKLYQYMVDQSVNTAEFVPAVLLKLIDYLAATSQNLHFMQRVICGSDLISVQSFKRIHALCGAKTRLINSYGLTEAVIDSTYFEYDETTLNQLSAHSLVPIGKPFAHVNVHVVDESGQELAADVEGELLIGGSALADGYWGQTALTQERFITIAHQARVFCTGDKAYRMKNGNIFFIGRNNFLAKVNGVRIELSEIEQLLNELESVEDAVVVARQAKHNPEKTELCAYLVGAEAICSSAQIIEHLKLLGLADNALPSHFYRVKEIPLNMNGKKERRAESLEVIDELGGAIKIVPPKTKIEMKIWEIWSELLCNERFGVTDSFSDCGGDSIKLHDMMLKVGKVFGVAPDHRNIHDLTIKNLTKSVQ